MNLLISSSSPADKGSGINGYVNQIAAGFARRGYRVHYLAPASESRSWLDQQGILSVPHCDKDDPSGSCAAIYRYIQQHDIEGIINNDNAFLQSLAPAVRCPFISVGHMNRTNVATLAAHNHQWLDYIVTISQDMQRHYCNHFGVPINKLPIVYNGVSNPGQPGLRSRENGSRLQVIFAGGMDRNKGAGLLARSLRAQPDLHRRIELHWFGQVAQRWQVQLANLGCVHFRGRVPRAEFLDALRNADVLLLPSYAEGCPMVMLEAMSFGVVPISSNGTGAMQRLIISGQEGFICDLRRWEDEMTACLLQLHQNTELLKRLGNAAYTRFQSDFDVEKTLDSLDFLLRNPVVDRSRVQQQIDVLRWHRPVIPGTDRAPLYDRFCIKAGILRRANKLSFSA